MSHVYNAITLAATCRNSHQVYTHNQQTKGRNVTFVDYWYLEWLGNGDMGIHHLNWCLYMHMLMEDTGGKPTAMEGGTVAT